MSNERGLHGRRVVAVVFSAGFSVAFAALMCSQLSLMSVLDRARADHAATQIADSQFTADLIAQTVTRAIAPIAGTQVADQVGSVTSKDPRVHEAVHDALIDAHRQVVDAAAPAEPAARGNDDVKAAITISITDAAERAGIDLAANGIDADAFAATVDPPSVVPTDIPNLGLRTVGLWTRWIAGLAAVVLALLTLAVHPRPGKALSGLGWKAGIVCAVWLVGLLVTGRIIGLVANTLFGDMLHDVWADAVPSMLLLVGAGVVLSVGVWFAGVAVDGLTGRR